MIKCNRCGNINTAGVEYCQSCGAPLSSKVDNGGVPHMGAQDQPGLPAWLESLRAGERSVPPINNNASTFSAPNLAEEGSLPSWMRAERNEARENTSPNPSVVFRPSTFPGQTDEGEGLYSGFNAQSLIDEQSLPSWMQEGRLATPLTPPSPQDGMWTGTPSQAQSQGFNAQSLIDEQSLPSWMQEGRLATPSAQVDKSAMLPPNPPVPQSGGMPASSLVQPENMPAWMKTLQQQQPTPPPIQQSQPPLAPGMPPSAHGFSARDLIDQQSLPSWMAQQSGQTPAAAPIPNQQQPGQGGFSASSLLDVSSLPPWLREGAQDQKGNMSSTWQAPPQPNQPWQAAPATNAPASGPGGNVSASSFIDMNALPEWLRANSMGGTPPPQSMPPTGGPRPGGYIPPRTDNMRVPSRPRSEMNPNENSEEAANVFASMLGVSSATPNYPTNPLNQQAGPAYGQPPYQQGYPAPNQQPYTQTGGLPGGNAMPPRMNGPQIPQSPGYSPGASGIYNNNAGYPASNQSQYNQGSGNSYLGTPQQAGNMQPGAPSAANQQRAGTKPAKRGFLDTIRDWFKS